jgi:hypothetical protein
VELSRRGFIAGAVASPIVAALPRLPRRLWAPGAPLRHFDAHQAVVVEEATARLIPGPADDLLELGHPGAREANVVGYVDALLSAFATDPPTIYAGGPSSDRGGGDTDHFAEFQPLSPIQDRYWRAQVAELQQRYAAGVVALDAAAGGDFAGADPVTKDLVLTQDPTGFRDLLFDHAIEGWLAAPEYGGNQDLSGWVEVQFPGDTIPRGYTAEEVSGSDGIDPTDPTGIVGLLLAHLTTVLDG